MNNEKKSDKDIPWRLLLRDFKGDLSEEEKIKLSMWMNSSTSSREVYAALKKLWIVLLGNQLENKKEQDIDSLWNKMEQRLHQQKTRSVRFVWRRFAWAAVAVLFVAGLYYYLNRYKANEREFVPTVYTALTGKSKILLPDSSIVWIKKGSTITCFIENNAVNRKVHLEGEAFFDVYKDAKRPFIVETKDIEVRVFGTAFTVKEDLTGETKVSLLRGSVAVEKDHLLKKIKPGEMAVYSPRRKNIETKKIDACFESVWAKDTLSIEKKTLVEVMKYLEKWYDIRIIVGQNISEDHAFTFTLTDEPIEEVMRLISRISPVQYHFNEDSILVINE